MCGSRGLVNPGHVLQLRPRQGRSDSINVDGNHRAALLQRERQLLVDVSRLNSSACPHEHDRSATSNRPFQRTTQLASVGELLLVEKACEIQIGELTLSVSRRTFLPSA